MNSKTSIRSPGLVDIHFHGAFGIDLMTASEEQLDELSTKLWENGIAAFCATTLSVKASELLRAVTRLGRWIRAGRWSGARPLGIHLEGPFIHPEACGAHPPEAIRPADLGELERLWTASERTLKLITAAPELLSPEQLKNLVAWARKRRITLAIGHSKATEEQARAALKAGFSGLTHAWNALNFHHRSPGVLGGVLGTPRTHVELIVDQVHLALTTIRWTLALHRKGACFVSDCVPAAATEPGTWHPFGHLAVKLERGACRLPEGHLAGGGKLLSEAYREWIAAESKATGRRPAELLRETLPYITTAPLEALGLKATTVAGRRVLWRPGAIGRPPGLRVD